MAENIINAKIREAHDTEENWNTSNPVLLKGQLAFSSNKYGYYKVGDGTQHWRDLDYHLYTEIQKVKTNGVFYNPTNVVNVETIDLDSNMNTIVGMVLDALPDADVARY